MILLTLCKNNRKAQSHWLYLEHLEKLKLWVKLKNGEKLWSSAQILLTLNYSMESLSNWRNFIKCVRSCV